MIDLAFQMDSAFRRLRMLWGAKIWSLDIEGHGLQAVNLAFLFSWRSRDVV